MDSQPPEDVIQTKTPSVLQTLLQNGSITEDDIGVYSRLRFAYYNRLAKLGLLEGNADYSDCLAELGISADLSGSATSALLTANADDTDRPESPKPKYTGRFDIAAVQARIDSNLKSNGMEPWFKVGSSWSDLSDSSDEMDDDYLPENTDDNDKVSRLDAQKQEDVQNEAGNVVNETINRVFLELLSSFQSSLTLDASRVLASSSSLAQPQSPEPSHSAKQPKP